MEVLQQSAALPNVISYSAVIIACEKGQQWQQALGLLAVMQQTAVLPNRISYIAVISACEMGLLWQQALGLGPWACWG